MKRSTISIMVFALSTLYATTPLLLYPGFIFAEDVFYYMNWAHQISMSMKEGICYPRWLSESNGGYGSPTTIFYSPLFYWGTGALSLFLSLIASLKVMTFLGFLFSGIFMYMFLMNFCNHAGSLAGGIAYQLLPYHIFDISWRGTLAETFAFLWLPLILHFTYKGFSEGRAHQWIGLALSYAGLVLTHIASAYIFTFTIAAFACSLSLSRKDFRALPKFMLAVFFGISLSAVYFIPMFFERGFVHIEALTEAPWGDYTRNFLFTNENSDNTFRINLEQIVWLKIFLVVISLILVYYKSRRYGGLLDTPLLILTIFSWLFVFSLFISTSISLPLWNIIPGLSTLQFPWRWMLVSTLSASILLGVTVDLFSFEDLKRDRFVRIFTAILHAILAGNIYLTSLYVITTEPIPEKDMEWILKDGGDVGEYRPIWSKDMRDLSGERGKPLIVFKEGRGEVEVVSWKSHSRLFTIDAAVPSLVRVSTFYYPGWAASIKGIEIPIGIEKDSGAMLLNIPPGRSEVLLEFRDTPLRRIANWISILSLFAALIGLIATRLKRHSHSDIISALCYI